jgi:hypothetical protein
VEGIMNIDTGEIRKLRIGEMLENNEVVLEKKPNPNCKICYGVGHTGKDLKTGKYLPCKCTYVRGYL